jgi:hypothetical protein
MQTSANTQADRFIVSLPGDVEIDGNEARTPGGRAASRSYISIPQSGPPANRSRPAGRLVTLIPSDAARSVHVTVEMPIEPPEARAGPHSRQRDLDTGAVGRLSNTTIKFDVN